MRSTELKHSSAPLGSPSNPIGAQSVGLAAAMASLTAAALSENHPAAAAPVVAERPPRRRHLWRVRAED